MFYAMTHKISNYVQLLLLDLNLSKKLRNQKTLFKIKLWRQKILVFYYSNKQQNFIIIERISKKKLDNYNIRVKFFTSTKY